MERLTYLLVLAGCVAVTLPLELVLGARVGRSRRSAVAGEYTLLALAAPAAAVALELAVLRTGLFRDRRYWLAVASVLAFQVPVDGLLTRPAATVVYYDQAVISGVRVPGHIPVEDFGFGFALVTLTLASWRWWLRRGEKRAAAGRADAERRDA